ncbi:NAC transcription factor 32-like [Aristolochia californica]|uniref:NAC transcription factor 32-like n=1 Tax=Aristolochia californica TaxID=171875 RepID=UPI0035DD9D95
MERGTKRKAEAESSLPPMSFPVPVGFRFNPTDVELVTHFLSMMLRSENVSDSPIHRASVYAFHPQKLTETYAPAREKVWYFFTPREAKHPNGRRPNRKADNGYWKASGSFEKITHQGRVVGNKRTLVFHQLQGDSKPKNAKKTDWIMHEYVSDEQHFHDGPSKTHFNSWALCRIRSHCGKGKHSATDLDTAHGIGTSQQLDGPALITPSGPRQTSSPDDIVSSATTASYLSKDSPTDTANCSGKMQESSVVIEYYEPSEDHFADQLWDYHDIGTSQQFDGQISYSVPSSHDNLLCSTTSVSYFSTHSPTDTARCSGKMQESCVVIENYEPSDDHFADQLWDCDFMVPAPADLPSDGNHMPLF